MENTLYQIGAVKIMECIVCAFCTLHGCQYICLYMHMQHHIMHQGLYVLIYVYTYGGGTYTCIS